MLHVPVISETRKGGGSPREEERSELKDGMGHYNLRRLRASHCLADLRGACHLKCCNYGDQRCVCCQKKAPNSTGEQRWVASACVDFVECVDVLSEGRLFRVAQHQQGGGIWGCKLHIHVHVGHSILPPPPPHTPNPPRLCHPLPSLKPESRKGRL